MNSSRLSDLFYFEPGGTSSKNLLHWVQLFQNKIQTKFDYGKTKNLQVYGQDTPPAYDLNQFKTYKIKTFLTFSNNDAFSYPEDLNQFVQLLPESTRNDLLTIKV